MSKVVVINITAVWSFFSHLLNESVTHFRARQWLRLQRYLAASENLFFEGARGVNENKTKRLWFVEIYWKIKRTNQQQKFQIFQIWIYFFHKKKNVSVIWIDARIAPWNIAIFNNRVFFIPLQFGIFLFKRNVLITSVVEVFDLNYKREQTVNMKGKRYGVLN